MTTDILSTYLAAGNDPEIRSALEQFGPRLLFKHVEVNLTAYLTPEGAQMNPGDSSPILAALSSRLSTPASSSSWQLIRQPELLQRISA